MLRGVACLMVVAFHYLTRGQAAGWIQTSAPTGVDLVTRYGYLGVQLFFMISGFVIFMSAQGASPRAFMASRGARLYPALWVAAPLTAAAAWWLQDERFQVSIPTLLVNLTLLPHWFNVEFVDGSYWSLAVEVQFYLMIALTLQARLLGHIEKLLIGWLLLCAVDMVRPVYPLERWLAVSYAPYFSAGICAYLIRERSANVPRIVLFGVSYVLALGDSLRSAIRVRSQEHIPLDDVWVLATVTGFFALFVAIALGRRLVPAWRWTVWAGALTYPVYLLHQNLGYMLIGMLERWQWPLSGSVILSAIAAAAGAWLIHRWVERPVGPWLRRRLIGMQSASGGQRRRAAPERSQSVVDGASSL